MSASQNARVLIVLCGLGFAALGLPDGVLGVAWPSLRRSFGLPLDALGVLLVATTAGYVTASAASGRIVARIGIGTLLALSCAATALAQCGYAAAGSWPTVVALGVVAGLGAGAIDAGINLHAATNCSTRTLALLHAGYGLGTTAGPAIMTPLLLSGAGWRAGYALLASIQLALAIGFAAVRSRWPRPPPARTDGDVMVTLAQTLRLRSARLAAVSFFVYVGIEAATGAWLYSFLIGSRGATMASAGAAVSTYWGGLMVARVLVALSPIPPEPGALMRGATGGLTLATVAIALDLGNVVDGAAVAALGLAAGPIFPALIAATPQRVPRVHAANAVGISVAAAAAGQALVPAGVGLAAESIGIEAIPRLIAAAALILVGIVFALARADASAARVVVGQDLLER